jgi:hypothetical protein
MKLPIRWWLVTALSVASLGAAGNPARLVDAVKSGDAAAIRAFIQQRVDVNAPESDGTTALHWAPSGTMPRPSRC